MKKIFYSLLTILILLSFKAKSLPALNSSPLAKATIFLDFDGQFVNASLWNGGTPFYCSPSGLSDVQITEVFNRVAEDYRPFNINITTDSAVFLAAPLTQRMRIIITPTSAWFTGVGGISYTGSFIWGDDTPGFVFSDRLVYTKNIAECCTHESGHTLGLSHQAKYSSTCALITVYNDGIGSGEIGWAPVMGNSYGRNLSGWNNGPTPSGCTIDQDNLSVITSRNGFTYRPDDYSNDPKTNPAVIDVSGFQFSKEGIISTNTDKDAFRFDLSKECSFRFYAKPFSVGDNNAGADLDIKATLYNSSRQVIQVYDPATILNVTIDTTLSAGTYFVVLEGTGNINTTNYGSLGSYFISGVYAPLTVMPVSQVLLSGKTDNEKHILSWNIITEESIKSLSLESSSNGTIFTTLSTFSPGTNAFNYVPLIKDNIFYRLKVISQKDQIAYSNVISLKATETGKIFTVATLVRSEITISASENYKYQLADMSGRVLKTGNENAGVNNINVNNYPNGIYFLQIISNSQRTTQRIVKL